MNETERRALAGDDQAQDALHEKTCPKHGYYGNSPSCSQCWRDQGPASPPPWEPQLPTFGSSDVYPSKAAGYGTEGLMAMAGSLAERAEEAYESAETAEWIVARAQIAQVYATLALTQAVRDQTDVLRGITNQLAETVERLEVLLEEVARDGE